MQSGKPNRRWRVGAFDGLALTGAAINLLVIGWLVGSWWLAR
jgi:hypothetical protein